MVNIVKHHHKTVVKCSQVIYSTYPYFVDIYASGMLEDIRVKRNSFCGKQLTCIGSSLSLKQIV